MGVGVDRESQLDSSEDEVETPEQWLMKKSLSGAEDFNIGLVPKAEQDFVFHFLAFLTFSIFIGLFIMQANMAWQSYKVLQHFSHRDEIPEMVYALYFDYLDWGINPDDVDMRVNTSIFVH